MRFFKKYWLPFLLSIAILLSFGHVGNAFGWMAGYLVYFALLVWLGWLYHRMQTKLVWYSLFAAVPICIMVSDMYIAFPYHYFPGIAPLLFVIGFAGFAGGLLWGKRKRVPAFLLVSASVAIVFLFVSNIERHLFNIHINPPNYADVKGIKPILSFTDISGKPISSSAFKNKVVLLDFWWTGCGGCWVKHIYIDSLYNHYKGRNDVAIYSVIDGNLDDLEKAQRILKKHPLQCPVLYDPEGKFIAKYKLLKDSYPFDIKIDKTGRLQEVYDGFGDADKVYYPETVNHINQLLAQ